MTAGRAGVAPSVGGGPTPPAFDHDPGTATGAAVDIPLAVVDYGAGNLVSVTHALEQVGAQVRVARRPADLEGAAGVVVPGVGASGPAMARLRRMGMVEALHASVAGGALFLGICLGMQLLFERSDEDGAVGLGWLAGPVRLIPDAPRLPHIGWNQVDAGPVSLFAGVRPGTPFYFVHSYAPVPADVSVVAGRTDHGGRFVSAVAAGRLFGVQFHPEKSGAAGLRLLHNFVQLVGEAQPRHGRLERGDASRREPGNRAPREVPAGRVAAGATAGLPEHRIAASPQERPMATGLTAVP